MEVATRDQPDQKTRERIAIIVTVNRRITTELVKLLGLIRQYTPPHHVQKS